MKTIVNSIVILAFLMFGSCSLNAQNQAIIDHPDIPSIKPLRLDGPRVGFTLLNQETFLKEDAFGLKAGTKVNPIVSQFGWQFEWKYFETHAGAAGLIEFIPLIGGLDQGMFIPSANVLIGFRTPEGWEVGLGPNASLVGTGFVIAGGYTFQSGSMSFPLNLAVIPGRDNTRISLLIGWNKRSH